MSQGAKNRDAILFKQLDAHSQALRSSAKDLADYIATINEGSSDFSPLSDSLHKIHSTPIEKIDSAINELKKAFQAIYLKIEDKDTLSYPLKATELAKLIEKYEILLQEAMKLFLKAAELNRKK